VATAPVPPLTLRNDVTIDDPLQRALEFLAEDSSYLKYDLAPVVHDNVLMREDIQIANQMIARMSPRVIDGIYARADVINAALALIPSRATLAAADDMVPWRALTELMGAVDGIPEVGLPRATKVLHKKRPALIPILDSVLEKYLRAVDRLYRSGDFAADAVALIRSYKRELDSALPTLSRAQGRAPHTRHRANRSATTRPFPLGLLRHLHAALPPRRGRSHDCVAVSAARSIAATSTRSPCLDHRR